MVKSNYEYLFLQSVPSGISPVEGSLLLEFARVSQTTQPNGWMFYRLLVTCYRLTRRETFYCKHFLLKKEVSKKMFCSIYVCWNCQKKKVVWLCFFNTQPPANTLSCDVTVVYFDLRTPNAGRYFFQRPMLIFPSPFPSLSVTGSMV